MKELKICSRCGAIIGDSWEEADAFNKGKIELHRSSIIFQPYAQGCGFVPPKSTVPIEKLEELWEKLKSHPVIVAEGGQHIRIEFGNDSYRLCRSCNDELIRMIASFFGLEPNFRVEDSKKIVMREI